MKKLSKVEVNGLEALFYDELITLASGFTYGKFLNQAMHDMYIGSAHSILDFGCGSAMAICNFLKYTKAPIIGFDIGKQMLKRSYKKCKPYNSVKIFYHDIRHKTPFIVDKVFISFVLHGFEQRDRLKIANNAYCNLKEQGEFCILDYNEFGFDKKPVLFKKLFNYFECPLALDFINMPIKNMLRTIGFKNFYEYYYYGDLVRLLIAKK